MKKSLTIAFFWLTFNLLYSQLDDEKGYISLNGRQISFPLHSDVFNELDSSPTMDDKKTYIVYVRTYTDESDEPRSDSDLRLHHIDRRTDEILLHSCETWDKNRPGIKCHPDKITSAAISGDAKKVFFSYEQDTGTAGTCGSAYFDMQTGEVLELSQCIIFKYRSKEYIVGEIFGGPDYDATTDIATGRYKQEVFMNPNTLEIVEYGKKEY